MRAETRTVLIALWKALESAGVSPSANAVIACARRHKIRFRDCEAKTLLAPFRHRPGQGQVVPAPLNVLTGTVATVPAPAGPGLRARKLELLVTKPPLTLTSESPHQNGEAKKAPDTSWVEPLRESVRAFGAVRFDRLSVDQRFLVGRLHALRFGNCTLKESANVKRGGQVAAALKAMADSRDFADLTVAQYMTLAADYFERNGKVPFFNPWLIRAVDEVLT